MARQAVAIACLLLLGAAAAGEGRRSACWAVPHAPSGRDRVWGAGWGAADRPWTGTGGCFAGVRLRGGAALAPHAAMLGAWWTPALQSPLPVQGAGWPARRLLPPRPPPPPSRHNKRRPRARPHSCFPQPHPPTPGPPAPAPRRSLLQDQGSSAEASGTASASGEGSQASAQGNATASGQGASASAVASAISQGGSAAAQAVARAATTNPQAAASAWGCAAGGPVQRCTSSPWPLVHLLRTPTPAP